MKLLILTSRFPYPIEKGDKLRIYHQIRILSKRHTIILCALSDEEIQTAAITELEKYCASIHIFRLQKWALPFHLIRPLFNPIPWQVAYFYRKRIHREIQTIIQTQKPDQIFCQLIRMAAYVQDEGTPSLLDYMDCFSVGMSRRAAKASTFAKPIFRWESQKLERYEATVFPVFDKHCIISAQDREHLVVAAKDTVQIIRMELM